MNLPNALTLTRIFLVPLLVVVLLTKFEGRQILGVPNEIVGAGIFGLASLTDWADGYLARRRRGWWRSSSDASSPSRRCAASPTRAAWPFPRRRSAK
ncbi:MAG: CDP-alcohol phosphatidyltransferase family protein [Acidobacteria bacterium]|nr:CDP-alcohol phosphatidyltransferase family protein [Acidobacteriota bacterium]